MVKCPKRGKPESNGHLNFNLFLKDVDVVYKACEHFPDLIDEVHGPLIEEHSDSQLEHYSRAQRKIMAQCI